MASESGIGAHFRNHGYVHAGWIIFLLLLVIAGLVVLTPSGEFLMGYVNFAATITSLFLGAFAIFYSVVANQGMTSSIAKAGEASEKIADVSARVDAASDRLEQETRRLIDEISLVPASVDKLSLEIVGKLDSFSAPPHSANELPSSSTTIPNYGAAISMYALVKASEHDGDINTDLIKEEVSPYFGGVIFGFLSAIKTFTPCDVKVDIVGANIRVTSLGKIEKEFLDQDLTNKGKPILVKAKECIDGMLGIEPDEASPGESSDDQSGEMSAIPDQTI